MDLGLQGKKAIVTGGSRGIGRAIARALAKEGASVAICARDEQAVHDAAEELSKATGSKVVGFPADTGNAEDIKRFVAAAAEALGGIDILVNNAARIGGTGGPDTLAALNEELIQQDFNTKVLGYLRVAHEVVPHMERARWGRIVNIAGGAARTGGAMSGGLRNAAVSNFSKGMSNELGPKGITVNVVHPSNTATTGWRERVEETARRQNISVEEAEAVLAGRNAIRRPVGAEEIAAVVVFLCSEQAGCITGESIAPSGGSFGGVIL